MTRALALLLGWAAQPVLWPLCACAAWADGGRLEEQVEAAGWGLTVGGTYPEVRGGEVA